MSFHRQIRDPETCFGPFVRQRMLNERTNSQKHMPCNVPVVYQPKPATNQVLNHEQLFEKTVQNIVSVISKKNKILAKSGILETVTR
jgi:hypothetical protein